MLTSLLTLGRWRAGKDFHPLPDYPGDVDCDRGWGAYLQSRDPAG